MDATLLKYREIIDALDYRLIDVFSQHENMSSEVLEIIKARMRVVEEVVTYKREHALPFFDPTREAAILASRCSYGERQGLSAQFVTDLFQQILKDSHKVYDQDKEI